MGSHSSHENHIARSDYLGDRKIACLDRAEQRLSEFQNSARTELTELTVADNLKDYLRPGDILCEKTQPPGQKTIRYVIYAGFAGDSKHEVIEKSDKDDSIDVELVPSYRLIRYFLVVRPRYRDTLEVARWLSTADIDAGFSSTHSNSEHFVTFCLTRSTKHSYSRQNTIEAGVRDKFAIISCPATNLAKLSTHPVYLALGGDMEFQKRSVKTAVPFGLPSEDIATGRRILIGCSSRGIWHYWLDIGQQPSGHTLHQEESEYALDDDRVQKFHR